MYALKKKERKENGKHDTPGHTGQTTRRGNVTNCRRNLRNTEDCELRFQFRKKIENNRLILSSKVGYQKMKSKRQSGTA